MMVVAEAPVVKVASAPVLIIETPVVNSDRNEEETEGCHPFDGTMFTLLIFSLVYSTKLGPSRP
jgi:hypothetical protein